MAYEAGGILLCAGVLYLSIEAEPFLPRVDADLDKRVTVFCTRLRALDSLLPEVLLLLSDVMYPKQAPTQIRMIMVISQILVSWAFLRIILIIL